MRITSSQLRQIIREELLREAMHDDDDTVGPGNDIISKTYGGPLPVGDFDDAEGGEFEEDEDEDGEFDAHYGHISGTLPDGRRLDPVTEKLIISQLEEQSGDPLFAGGDVPPIIPNSYDILDAIGPGGMIHSMQQVAQGRDLAAARTAMAWLKHLKANQEDVEGILHKAIYETLKHAVSVGAVAMNDEKAHMRWDGHEFYALPSGEVNESRRKRR